LVRSGDSLFSNDGLIYQSLANQVEQIIAELPANEGLNAYRITADANAKEIMAQANGPFDERALQQIVRLYFLSSLGDDAAMTLSSIYMDEFDFVGAFRMLQKIVSLYPDPSVSKVEVFNRIAICRAMMGETKYADEAILAARKASGRDDPKINDVESVIPELQNANRARQSEAGFSMPLANKNRSGVMPSLPVRTLENDLQSIWQYRYATQATRWADLKGIKPIIASEDAPDRIAESVSSKERNMITKWRKYGWRPTGDLLFHEDKVFFKTSIDLTVWDSNATSETVLWRPLWRNRYQIDDQTKTLIELRRRLQRSRRQSKQFSGLPSSDYEIQMFSDRIAAQMSIQNGTLYTIEGPRFNDVFIQNSFQSNFRMNVHSRRSRSNYLSAYDADSGRILWTLPSLEDRLMTEKLLENTPNQNAPKT
ncbi:MAG: hypothetical protein AAGA30_21660, partial [Planctomycetota bacterium]